KGFIQPSQSVVALLLLLIKKLGSRVYVCIIYQSINNMILKIRYPLLLIKEILNTIYYTK
ncbi:hypothetical protein NEUTE2DRAFT_45161, partial [Neurospora tetrasperma FGSC 2509]